MRKPILSVAALFFAMFLFVACNNPANTAAETEETTEVVDETTDSVTMESDTVNVEVTEEEIVD
jgi:YbbR domain-containing protein